MGRFSDTDPRHTLPNMMIEEGIVSFPLSDIVQMAIATVSKRDWLNAILDDEDGFDALVEAVGSRYHEPGTVDDRGRRRLLHALQAQVHDAALDAIRQEAETRERAAYQQAHTAYANRQFKLWLGGVTACLKDKWPDAYEHLCKTRGLETCFRTNHPDPYVIFGDEWKDARDFWRQEFARRFPAPVDPASTPLPGAIDGGAE